MAEQDRGSDDPQLAAIARHALHDEELIAAFAAGDIDDKADAERARALVERCTTCKAIHADLGSLRAAIRASGSAEQRAATQPAPRDFRLSVEDATRLRPGTPIGRIAVRFGWRRRLGMSIASFGRPVGAAMATLGVVGLLIGTLTLGGPLPVAMSGNGQPSAPGAGVDQSVSVPESTLSRTSYGPSATGKRDLSGGQPESERDSGSPGPLVLFGGSIAFVVLGLTLLLAARRSGRGLALPPGN